MQQPGNFDKTNECPFCGTRDFPSTDELDSHSLDEHPEILLQTITMGIDKLEAECIHLDKDRAPLVQDPSKKSKLNRDHWERLFATHQNLLWIIESLFLLSQHPSADPSLYSLASWNMIKRMWQNVIYPFLGILTRHLPDSFYIRAFLDVVYSMMIVMHEKVPAFELTWIECLGDLGRWRMRIENDIALSKDWREVSRAWYLKASNKAPTNGRLYEHLAIVAEPHSLEQLFLFSKALCAADPFAPALEILKSIMLSSTDGKYHRPLIDTVFIKAQALLLTSKTMEGFEHAMQEFLDVLNNHIDRDEFTNQGCYIAIFIIAEMLGFGSKGNILMKFIDSPRSMSDAENAITSNEMQSFKLAKETVQTVLQHTKSPNILPFLYVTLVFMDFMSPRPATCPLKANFPWHLLAEISNRWISSDPTLDPTNIPIRNHIWPLPEDIKMQGLLWARRYHSKLRANTGDEKHLEATSTITERKKRILCLAYSFTRSAEPRISYDEKNGRFQHVGLV
jgi:hypothetical protein